MYDSSRTFRNHTCIQWLADRQLLCEWSNHTLDYIAKGGSRGSQVSAMWHSVEHDFRLPHTFAARNKLFKWIEISRQYREFYNGNIK